MMMKKKMGKKEKTILIRNTLPAVWQICATQQEAPCSIMYMILYKARTRSTEIV